MDLINLALVGHKTCKVTFPDGKVIPFRLLSWSEFNTYWELSRKGTIPACLVEENIFTQCVLDSYIVDTMLDLNAGVVTTVVSVIMQLSGPVETSTFNDSIQAARQIVDSLNSQIEMIICRAFPAYKPEDLSKLHWQDVLLRLAQAERILITKNPPELTEAIKLLSSEELEQLESKPQRKPGQVDVNALVKDGKQFANSEFAENRNEMPMHRELNPRSVQTEQKPQDDNITRAQEMSAKRRQKIKQFKGR